MPSVCEYGAVRLEGGGGGGGEFLEGRLEVCVNNAWGTVCGSSFSRDDASVVCAQLDLDPNG